MLSEHGKPAIMEKIKIITKLKKTPKIMNVYTSHGTPEMTRTPPEVEGRHQPDSFSQPSDGTNSAV